VHDLDRFDLQEIATALSDQGAYEHQWLVDPATGETVFWTSDTGIDGQNPVDLDEPPRVQPRSASRYRHRGPDLPRDTASEHRVRRPRDAVGAGESGGGVG